MELDIVDTLRELARTERFSRVRLISVCNSACDEIIRLRLLQVHAHPDQPQPKYRPDGFKKPETRGGVRPTIKKSPLIPPPLPATFKTATQTPTLAPAQIPASTSVPIKAGKMEIDWINRKVKSSSGKKHTISQGQTSILALLVKNQNLDPEKWTTLHQLVSAAASTKSSTMALISKLRSLGFVIDQKRNSGYRLMYTGMQSSRIKETC